MSECIYSSIHKVNICVKEKAIWLDDQDACMNILAIKIKGPCRIVLDGQHLTNLQTKILFPFVPFRPSSPDKKF